MSWFSDHVYDASHMASGGKELVSEVVSTPLKVVTFGLYEDTLVWDEEGFSLFGNNLMTRGSGGYGIYETRDFLFRDFPNFIKFPADSLSPNEEGDGTFNRWRQQWRQQWGDWKGKMMEMAGGQLPSTDMYYEGGEEEEAASIKGPGKMRGRDPEMAFNEGVKGYGRSSLKIGKGGGGGGSRIGGKFDAYKSGRYSMPS